MDVEVKTSLFEQTRTTNVLANIYGEQILIEDLYQAFKARMLEEQRIEMEK